MAGVSDITIKTIDYRTCLVKGKKALFHKWNEFSNVVAPGIAVGSAPGGQIKYTLGLVEYEDGTVEEVLPHSIKFIDNKIKEYAFKEE